MTPIADSSDLPVPDNDRRPRFGPFSFAITLAACMAALVALAVVIVLVIQLIVSSEATFELLNEKAEIVVDRIETGVRDHLDPAVELVEFVASRIESGAYDLTDKARLGDLLTGSVAATPHIAFVTIIDLEHQLFGIQQHEGDRIELRRSDERDNLVVKRVMAELGSANGVSWGEPVVIPTGDAIINLRRPLRRDGRLIGLLAAGITVPELSELVTEAGDQSDATAFILYGRDQVLAHPNLASTQRVGPSRAATVALGDAGDIVLGGLWQGKPIPLIEGVAGRIEAVKVVVGDYSYAVLYTWSDDFGEQPWAFGAWFPREDIVGEMRRLIWAGLGGIGVLLVALLAAWLLGLRIAKPVRRLAAGAQHIGEFDLTQVERLPPSMIRELNDQTQAFNTMLTSLRSFETYVPRSLVKRLIREGEDQTVESVERELTVMFTDIVGFTAMAEGMPANDVARLLNHHFALLGACVEAAGGTLDKYIGDAIMAFWGAPEKQKDRAVRACRAALEMAAAIEADNAKRVEAGAAPVRIRIGIHTGRVVVGNVGWPGRINYTIVGDTVNTCQRLEALGKEMDRGAAVTILISGATAERLDEGFKVEPAGSFAVKGKTEAIEVYRLLP